MDTIEFEIEGIKYRFRRLDRRNLVIEEWKSSEKKDGQVVDAWVQISGYHSSRSIRRELLELVGDGMLGETLQGHFARIARRLEYISTSLERLLPPG